MARLKELYRTEIVPAMMKEFGYRNPLQVPRLDKITLNMGVGEAVANDKAMDAAVADMTQIAGQRPVITRAKKSIANFKIRAGMRIGCMVTLRGDRMYEFADRLFNATLPRVRDFNGLNPNSFDGHGNYALGMTEQIVFPEIDYDKVDRIRGLSIVICTTSPTDAEARRLLRLLGCPIRTDAGPGGMGGEL